MAGIFAVIMSTMLGLLFWDRLTIVRKAKQESLSALESILEQSKTVQLEQTVEEAMRRIEKEGRLGPDSGPASSSGLRSSAGRRPPGVSLAVNEVYSKRVKCRSLEGWASGRSGRLAPLAQGGAESVETGLQFLVGDGEGRHEAQHVRTCDEHEYPCLTSGFHQFPGLSRQFLA